MELPGKPRLLAKAPHWGYLHTKSPEMSSAHRQEPCPGEPVITGAGEEAPAVADRLEKTAHSEAARTPELGPRDPPSPAVYPVPSPVEVFHQACWQRDNI